MLAGLSTPIQGVLLRKEAAVVGGPLNLILPMLGLHIDLDQRKNEATPYFTPVAISESSFFSFSFSGYLKKNEACVHH